MTETATNNLPDDFQLTGPVQLTGQQSIINIPTVWPYIKPIALTELKEPFPPNEIEWRVGSTNKEKTKGMALAYITARHVMERLDAVCGPENWQDRYEFAGARTVCYLSIKINGEWVTKADGAGDSDVEAEKGAISDAIKRAAVKWGIGRYLYDLASPWVELEQRGNSYVIAKPEYDRLEKLLGGAQGQVVPEPVVERLSAYRAKEVVNWPNMEKKIRASETAKVLDNWQLLAKQIEPLLPVQWNELLQTMIDDRRKELQSGTSKAVADYEASATDRPFPGDLAETEAQRNFRTP